MGLFVACCSSGHLLTLITLKPKSSMLLEISPTGMSGEDDVLLPLHAFSEVGEKVK